MRFNRDILAIVVLLLIFIIGGVLLGGRSESESRLVGKELVADPSIYNDRASGSKACFDWTGRLGYRPQAWRQGWENLSRADAPILLVIDPLTQNPLTTLSGGIFGSDDEDSSQNTTILGPQDAPKLLNWLRAGHTAILMSSRLPTGRSAGASHEGDRDTFGDALDVIVETAARGQGGTEFAPQQPTAETHGILSLHSQADARIRRRAPDGVALFGDSSGPFVLAIAIGRGRLIAVADSGFVSNANLPRAENAVFLANVLARAARPGDTILFDEYHHGDTEAQAGTTVWSVLGRPLQLALIQLLLAFVVVVGVLAVRFGTPIPLLRGLNRTSAEYVTSLAGLYRQAQASTTALEIVYRQFLRDLCARFALAPDVNLQQLADTAARRGHVDAATLRRLLATCEQRLDERQITENELLDLVRQMERIRKDIGLA